MIIDYRSPVSGEHLDISQSPDDTFSQYMVGKGFVIFPTDHKIFAPIDGVISHIFPNRYAFVIKHATGINLLIHIGLGTGALKGMGVSLQISQGQHVKQGDWIAEFDDLYLKKHIEAMVVLVVFVQNETLMILNQDQDASHIKMLLDVR